MGPGCLPRAAAADAQAGHRVLAWCAGCAWMGAWAGAAAPASPWQPAALRWSCTQVAGVIAWVTWAGCTWRAEDEALLHVRVLSRGCTAAGYLAVVSIAQGGWVCKALLLQMHVQQQKQGLTCGLRSLAATERAGPGSCPPPCVPTTHQPLPAGGCTCRLSLHPLVLIKCQCG